MTVRDWLALKGADVSGAATRFDLIGAAQTIGVSFKPRKGLATVAMLDGKAYIGRSEANPTDPDPYLALEALVFEVSNDAND